MSTYIEQLVEEQLRNAREVSITKLMNSMREEQLKYDPKEKEYRVMDRQLDILENIFKVMWKELRIANEEATFILEGIWVATEKLSPFVELQEPSITVGFFGDSREARVEETFKTTYKIDGIVIRNPDYEVCIIENNDVENIINYNKEVEEAVEKALQYEKIKLVVD